jgi:hypothetical protein
VIPKRLHFCWFGTKPIHQELRLYQKTWQTYCPDYEIVRWDESNFDINAHEFTRTAFARGMYSKVSNYVRAWVLYHHGGIYLDTDVELKRNLDVFLRHRAFSGFEAPGLSFAALWGSEPGHSWPLSVLDHYDRPVGDDEPTNTEITTNILREQFGIDPTRDERQEGKDGVVIYPSTCLTLDLAANYATHHFTGLWLPSRPDRSYKSHVHIMHFRSQLEKKEFHSSRLEAVREYAFCMSVVEQIHLLFSVFGRVVKSVACRGPGRLYRLIRPQDGKATDPSGRIPPSDSGQGAFRDSVLDDGNGVHKDCSNAEQLAAASPDAGSTSRPGRA